MTPTIRVEAKRLTAALGRVLPLLQDNPIMPALSAVQMRLEKDRLYLTGGSQLQQLTIELDRIDNPDEIELAACPELQPLYRVLRTLPDTPVWLGLENQRLHFSSSINQSELPCFPYQDYPALPVSESALHIVTIPKAATAELAKELLRLSRFAGQDAQRFPHFAGIWLTPSPGHALHLEACQNTIVSDGFILDCGWPDTLEPILLPHDSVSATAALLLSAKEPVVLEVYPSWVSLSHDDELWIRRLETVYPQLFAIMWPDDGDMNLSVEVEREAFIGTLRRVLAMPGLPDKAPISHTALLSVDSDRRGRIDYRHDDYSSTEVIGSASGDKLEWACGFDVRNLLTLASTFESPTLTLGLEAAGKKRRFIHVGGGDKRAICMAILYKNQ